MKYRESLFTDSPTSPPPSVCCPPHPGSQWTSLLHQGGSGLQAYLGTAGALKLRLALPLRRISNSAQQTPELSPGETNQAPSVRITPDSKPPASAEWACAGCTQDTKLPGVTLAS